MSSAFPRPQRAVAYARSLAYRIAPGVVPAPNPKPEPGLFDVDGEGTVTSEGIAVHYYLYGPPAGDEAEATVVFIHGFTLAATSWYLQAEYLRRAYPRVRSVLIDLRGHGTTGMVDPKLCTVAGLGNDVMAVLEEVAPRGPVFLVGHSLGGLAAFNVVRRAPLSLYRRFRGALVIASSIERLAAQGLPQILALPAAQNVYAAAKSSPDEVDQLRSAVKGLIAPGLAVGVFRRPNTDYDLVEFHARMIDETPIETFVGFFTDLQEHDEVAAQGRLQGVAGGVIVGEKDAVTPREQATRIKELWPQSWQVTARGAGHMIILEAPDVVNAGLGRILAATGVRQGC